MKVRLGAADLEDGEMRGYELPGGRLVLLGRVGDRYAAIDDWCNHAGCQISMGWLDKRQDGGATAVCPCHEIGFDLQTGRNLTSPELCDDQPAYDVDVRDGEVWVKLPVEGGHGNG